MQRVFFNFHGSAVFGVLAFLGTALALLLLAALIAFLVATGRRRSARWAALAAAGLVGLYAVLLLAHSARSRTQVAEAGEEKYFCDLDCHLAYSVTGVRREKTLEPAGTKSGPRGVFTIVTVKTRFDEKTISPRRGREPLTPNGRRIAVRDAQGRVHGASLEGAALTSVGGASIPLTTPLRPGESYTTTFVFDLPDAIEAPLLLLTEDSPVTLFLIGHENSFGHAKTVFLLEGEGLRRAAPHSTRMSAFPVPIFPVALSRTLTTTR